MYYISFLLDGKEISVVFKQGFFRGITSVTIYSKQRGSRLARDINAQIISVTPALTERIKEAALKLRIKLSQRSESKFN